MPETWILILLHQLGFQGMFVLKNIILHRKIGKAIRGKNIEATISIAFFTFFIGVAVVTSFFNSFLYGDSFWRFGDYPESLK